MENTEDRSYTLLGEEKVFDGIVYRVQVKKGTLNQVFAEFLRKGMTGMTMVKEVHPKIID